MEVWKIIFLSKWVICRFHVNLPGCSRVLQGSENLLMKYFTKFVQIQMFEVRMFYSFLPK